MFKRLSVWEKYEGYRQIVGFKTAWFEYLDRQGARKRVVFVTFAGGLPKAQGEDIKQLDINPRDARLRHQKFFIEELKKAFPDGGDTICWRMTPKEGDGPYEVPKDFYGENRPEVTIKMHAVVCRAALIHWDDVDSFVIPAGCIDGD